MQLAVITTKKITEMYVRITLVQVHTLPCLYLHTPVNCIPQAITLSYTHNSMAAVGQPRTMQCHVTTVDSSFTVSFFRYESINMTHSGNNKLTTSASTCNLYDAKHGNHCVIVHRGGNFV